MDLAGIAAKYRTVVLTLVTMLMVWGVASYMTMPRREDPEFVVRTCAVSTAWPGAPASKVEELITKPIEEACDRIDTVDLVHSKSVNGLSTVFVDAEDTVSRETINNVWDKVRANVSRVRMPEPGLTPIVNDEYGDTYVLLVCVYQTPLPGETEIAEANTYTLRELDVFSEHIKDELRLLDGVAKSEQYGVVEEAIYAETDANTWSQLQLTTDGLQQVLQSRNIVAPGGSIDTKSGRFFVKPGGELNDVSEMNDVIVGLSGDDNRQVYLSDLGVEIVRDYIQPRKVISRFGDANGAHPCVVVALSIKSGANIVDVCEAAKDRLQVMREIEQSIPPDIGTEYISDQSTNVTAKIDQVLGNVFGAIVIVVIVVYLLVGFRSAAVMAANIPVVVLSAIALVTVFDVQLEQISLASIIIALGLLVDNAVQVCDQSRTNQIAGMKPIEATVKGARQLSTAMLMGTATTVAAFAPMLIGLVGSMREYIYSLPVTISITLGISWLLAMMFCTILAAAFIRAPADPSQPSAPLPWLFAKFMTVLSRRKGGEKGDDNADHSDPIDRVFRQAVRSCINHKFMTIGAAVALFIVALQLPVASEFFPKDMRDQFPIEIYLPENTTIAKTDDVVQQVETILQKLSPLVDENGVAATDADGQPIQRVRGFRSMVGRGGSRWYLSWGPEPENAGYAEILVRTTEAKYTPNLARRVRQIAENGDEQLGINPIVGARIVPQELQLGPSEEPVAIRVIGAGFADMQTMNGFADRVKEMIRNTPGTWDVADSWGVSGYQLRIDVDEDSANAAGVTNLDIADTLNAYYSGHQLTTFREGDHQIPVYLRLKQAERESLEGISSAFVEGSGGTKVPLDSVASITPRWEPARIERRDLNRVITVTSQVENGVGGNDVVLDIMKSDEMKQLISELPAGFTIEVGGNLEQSGDSAADLMVCLAISLLTIILLLVIQYNGLAKPMIILTTLPMALIGALPGLYFTGNPLGFMPQLGILSLFGIVLNTGIIFIEFADLLIKDAAEKSDGSGPICGLTRTEFRECLVDACKQRLMPIFLTTATTIGGLLPLAMSGGPLWEGMSWCMIFGLIVATLLTLLVVPALYALFVETFRVKPVQLDTE